MNDSASDYVVELLESFAKTSDLVASLNEVLPHVVRQMDCEAGSLFLAVDNQQQLECVSCVGPVDIRGFKMPSTQGIVGRVFGNQLSDVVNDVDQDKDHSKASDDRHAFITKAVLTVPVSFKDQRYGVLQLLNKTTGDVFSLEDVSSAKLLASSVAIGYHSVLITQKIADTEVLRRDVEMAGEVQAALTPAMPENSRIAAEVLPYRQLSGDFFYYTETDQGMYFIEADVSGKGVAASLTMAQALSLFRFMAQQGRSIKEIAEAINHQIHRFSNIPRFLTAFIGRHDERSGELEYFNAGHGDVLFKEGSEVKVLTSMASPLGVVGEELYSVVTQIIKADQWRLLAVSDGITEAEINAKEFGTAGLRMLLEKTANDSPIIAVEKIMRLVKSGRMKLTDDATVMVVDAALCQS